MDTPHREAGVSRRSRIAALGALLSFALLVGAYAIWQSRPPLYERVIRNAESMTAHRFISRGSEGDMMLSSYEPARDPVPVGGELNERFIEILTSPPAEEPPACEPTPGVGLTVQRGDHEVGVVICLNCGLLIFEMNGERTGSRYLPRDTTNRLRSAFADAFPDDDAIRALAHDGKFRHEL